MRLPTTVISFVLTLIAGTVVQAERPVQPKAAATDVIVGTVQKVRSKQHSFLRSGVLTEYTATVKVETVQRGPNVKPGDTIAIGWFHVTKRPSRPVPMASGMAYPVKEKAHIRAWLRKEKNKPFTIGKNNRFGVIYNHDAIEEIKGPK